MQKCMQCERPLDCNDIGAYKKFINRGAREFMCKSCLAAKLNISEDAIDRKIEQFKRQGCVLFV